MLKCPNAVLASALLRRDSGKLQRTENCNMKNWLSLCDWRQDVEHHRAVWHAQKIWKARRSEGKRRKRLERSGLGGVGVAFWEGQTSRGQECTFSSFARSPSEYKFATLSSWRGRYPHRREFSNTAGVPEASIATLTEWISNFFHPHRLRIPITRLPIYSSRWKITASLFVLPKKGQPRDIFEGFSYSNTFLSQIGFSAKTSFYLSPWAFIYLKFSRATRVENSIALDQFLWK